MPAKVNALIDFLVEVYGTEPYWDRSLGIELPTSQAPAAAVRDATLGDNVTRLGVAR